MLINGKYRCPGCMALLNEENEKCNCGFDPEKEKNDPHCLQIGTILYNKYVIGKIIGEGGFGITYVGWDQDLDIKVAIKEFFLNGHSLRNTTVSSEISSTAGNSKELFEVYREKFINEARVLAGFMNESGIVSVFNFFKENNTAYISMEFVEGQTLKEYLKKKGKLSVEETLDILYPVMRSLSKVHDRQLIHRDISPDNVIITKEGRGKLLDFGAARDVSDENKSLSVVLKHGYAPMEQYQSHGNQGPWTDVYALCATIYKCITGVIPTESVERATGIELANPHDLESSVPVEVGKVLLKGMALMIPDRYQSMEELEKALKAAAKAPAEESKKEEVVTAQKSQETAAEENKQQQKSIERHSVERNIVQQETKKGAYEELEEVVVAPTPRPEVVKHQASNRLERTSSQFGSIDKATVTPQPKPIERQVASQPRAIERPVHPTPVERQASQASVERTTTIPGANPNGVHRTINHHQRESKFGAVPNRTTNTTALPNTHINYVSNESSKVGKMLLIIFIILGLISMFTISAIIGVVLILFGILLNVVMTKSVRKRDENRRNRDSRL